MILTEAMILETDKISAAMIQDIADGNYFAIRCKEFITKNTQKLLPIKFLRKDMNITSMRQPSVELEWLFMRRKQNPSF